MVHNLELNEMWYDIGVIHTLVFHEHEWSWDMALSIDYGHWPLYHSLAREYNACCCTDYIRFGFTQIPQWHAILALQSNLFVQQVSKLVAFYHSACYALYLFAILILHNFFLRFFFWLITECNGAGAATTEITWPEHMIDIIAVQWV